MNNPLAKDVYKRQLHKAGKQEHEPERFTVYHGAFKYQYHKMCIRDSFFVLIPFEFLYPISTLPDAFKLIEKLTLAPPGI